MQAVLVAAGGATRLRPLTDSVPKCLLDVDGRSILEHQLEALACCGVKDLVVVTGYHSQQIEERLPSWARTVFNPFYATTNNMASLWLARFLMTDSFLYLHSDVLFDPRILSDLAAAPAEITLCVDRKPCDEEDMKVALDRNHVLAVRKNMPPPAADGEFIGLAKIQGEGVTELNLEMERILRAGGFQEYFAYAVERLAAEGFPVEATFVEPGLYWAEIDTREDLEEARRALQSGALRPN